MKAESMVRGQYSEIKSDVNNAWGELRNAAIRSLSQTREKIMSDARNAADVVDESAHKNPWAFMAAAGAVSILTGYMLGRKTRH